MIYYFCFQQRIYLKYKTNVIDIRLLVGKSNKFPSYEAFQNVVIGDYVTINFVFVIL